MSDPFPDLSLVDNAAQERALISPVANKGRLFDDLFEGERKGTEVFPRFRQRLRQDLGWTNSDALVDSAQVGNALDRVVAPT